MQYLSNSRRELSNSRYHNYMHVTHVAHIVQTVAHITHVCLCMYTAQRSSQAVLLLYLVRLLALFIISSSLACQSPMHRSLWFCPRSVTVKLALWSNGASDRVLSSLAFHSKEHTYSVVHSPYQKCMNCKLLYLHGILLVLLAVAQYCIVMYCIAQYCIKRIIFAKSLEF